MGPPDCACWTIRRADDRQHVGIFDSVGPEDRGGGMGVAPGHKSHASRSLLCRVPGRGKRRVKRKDSFYYMKQSFLFGGANSAPAKKPQKVDRGQQPCQNYAHKKRGHTRNTKSKDRRRVSPQCGDLRRVPGRPLFSRTPFCHVRLLNTSRPGGGFFAVTLSALFL